MLYQPYSYPTDGILIVLERHAESFMKLPNMPNHHVISSCEGYPHTKKRL